MQLHAIETGLFKLDGGAMFGVVPKSIWSRSLPPDKNNLCTWAMRCLLIEANNRLILVDTGLGDKQSEKFFSYVEPHGDDSLFSSIEAKGYSPDDITDVILTHLHFDHVGGAVSKDKNGKYYPTFKNAVYWSHSSHWQWAMEPNAREKASFLKENFEPLMSNDQVKFIDEQPLEVPEIDFIIANGHTESQIIPKIEYKGHTLIYCADLMPSVHHLPLPYVMAYDVRPLITLKEREHLYAQALEKNWVLMFEHDATNECCTLTEQNGRVKADQVFKLSEL